MIDDGFICLSLYTVVNIFFLSEDEACRQNDDVSNMNSNCNILECTGPILQAGITTELLDE